MCALQNQLYHHLSHPLSSPPPPFPPEEKQILDRQHSFRLKSYFLVNLLKIATRKLKVSTFIFCKALLNSAINWKVISEL